MCKLAVAVLAVVAIQGVFGGVTRTLRFEEDNITVLLRHIVAVYREIELKDERGLIWCSRHFSWENRERHDILNREEDTLRMRGLVRDVDELINLMEDIVHDDIIIRELREIRECFLQTQTSTGRCPTLPKIIQRLVRHLEHFVTYNVEDSSYHHVIMILKKTMLLLENVNTGYNWHKHLRMPFPGHRNTYTNINSLISGMDMMEGSLPSMDLLKYLIKQIRSHVFDITEGLRQVGLEKRDLTLYSRELTQLLDIIIERLQMTDNIEFNFCIDNLRRIKLELYHTRNFEVFGVGKQIERRLFDALEQIADELERLTKLANIEMVREVCVLFLRYVRDIKHGIKTEAFGEGMTGIESNLRPWNRLQGHFWDMNMRNRW